MPDCDYCGASFESEDAYLRHLREDHRDELGPIDRRRVEAQDGGGDLPLGPIIIGAVVLISFAIVVYVTFVMGGSGEAAGEPHSVGSIHEHGTIEIVIDGEALDLAAPEYLDRDAAFHFHDGYYEQYGVHIYHVEAQGVTLQYALGTLDIEVAGDGSVLTVDGETYRDDDPDTEVIIEVNGEPVEPGEHVLRGVESVDRAAAGDGEDVRVEVRTAG